MKKLIGILSGLLIALIALFFKNSTNKLKNEKIELKKEEKKLSADNKKLSAEHKKNKTELNDAIKNLNTSLDSDIPDAVEFITRGNKTDKRV